MDSDSPDSILKIAYLHSMKHILFLLFIFPLVCFSQTKFPTQPGADYYDMVKRRTDGRAPAEKDLTSAVAKPLPGNLRDSLFKYDWFETASYSYVDKRRTSLLDSLRFREERYANVQLDFKRYDQSGVIREMQLSRLKNGSFTVFTTTFDDNTAQKLIGVENIKGVNYLVTEIYGEKEKQKILSYENGVLLMEVAASPGDMLRRYRIAYVAVPKRF